MMSNHKTSSRHITTLPCLLTPMDSIRILSRLKDRRIQRKPHTEKPKAKLTMISAIAMHKYQGRQVVTLADVLGSHPLSFKASTRLSGADLPYCERVVADPAPFVPANISSGPIDEHLGKAPIKLLCTTLSHIFICLLSYLVSCN